MNEYLRMNYYGNTVLQYLYVLAGIIVAWIIFKIIRNIVIVKVRKWAGKTKNSFDDVLITGIDRFVIPYLYLFCNYILINQLNMTRRADKFLTLSLTVVTIYYVVRVLNHSLQYSLYLYLHKRKEGDIRIKQFNGILLVIKVFVWMLGLLFFLDNIGYHVTTILAGLGIGGIAVALAAQNILSDLFSYFVIFLDKPFEIGDFIVVGSQSGTVERIGIKTSHVRSLGGEQMIIPNADLVKSTINNYKRLERRRVVFEIRVVYNTPIELLEEIPGILKAAVTKREKILFDRAHLQNFESYYINYEVVYSVLSDNYNLFMDIQQSILLEILAEFKMRGIEIAIPAQTIAINGETKEKVNEDR